MSIVRIILYVLLKVLIIKEVIMQASPQNNLKNHHMSIPKMRSRWNLLKYPIQEHISIRNNDRFSKPELDRKSLFEIHIIHSINNEVRETFTTTTESGDFLSIPGIPTMKLNNFANQLYWEPVKNNDHSQIILYRLEGFVDNNYKHEKIKIDKKKSWNLYYNGTNNYWIIPKNMDQKYQFRVQAENSHGSKSAWSQSNVVDLTKFTGETFDTTQYSLTLILGIITTIIIIMLMCVISYNYFYSYRKQRKSNKNANRCLTLSELAAFDEVSGKNSIRSNLYVPTLQCVSDYSDYSMPKIKQEQITLGNYIGSTEFGHVFQGKMKELEGSGTMSVAIKMLRKNAPMREKTKLLQKAKLMNQFQHKHVLKLLGVCFDTDLPLLVLELMEAGDLLNYLRDSRFMQLTDSQDALRLQDLLVMCEDVARGCCYLEEMHFVHRDLACRNCLVSAKNRKDRVVKIGDFGFAKDVYEDGYYQEEEGLLPVRWMPPESLIDGIFSSQSDVWAFGVLMWEVMSLGQQPYFTKTNIEVVDYLREGGRLSKPFNCPSTLYELMLRCWSTADARPSFKICLENIIAVRSNVDDAIIKPVNTESATNECSWKFNSSEESQDNQFPCQSSDDARITINDDGYLYECLRSTFQVTE